MSHTGSVRVVIECVTGWEGYVEGRLCHMLED